VVDEGPVLIMPRGMVGAGNTTAHLCCLGRAPLPLRAIDFMCESRKTVFGDEDLLRPGL
jgi:hypothetical protein